MTNQLKGSGDIREILGRLGLQHARGPGERIPPHEGGIGQPRQLAVLPFLRRAPLLVPLGDNRAAAAALGLYNPQKRFPRVAKAIATASLRLGIAQPFLRTRLKVAEPQPGTLGQSTTLYSHLQEVFEAPEVEVAVSLGTPGRHRTPLVQVIGTGGRILGYVKVGWNPETASLVKHEAAALRQLESIQFSTADVPRVLQAGRWKGCYLLSQSPPTGRSRGGSDRLTQEHLTFLRELHSLTPGARSSRVEESFKAVGERLDQLRAWGLKAEARLIRQLLDVCIRRAGDRMIPIGPRHGDFAPWNTLALRGRVFVLDWEYFDEAAPVGWDLFHYVIQSAVLVDQWSSTKLWAFLMGDFRRVADGFLRSLQVPGDLYEVLLALYLADVASWGLVRDGGVETAQAARLLHARVAMMSRIISAEFSEGSGPDGSAPSVRPRRPNGQ